MPESMAVHGGSSLGPTGPGRVESVVNTASEKLAGVSRTAENLVYGAQVLAMQNRGFLEEYDELARRSQQAEGFREGFEDERVAPRYETEVAAFHSEARMLDQIQMVVAAAVFLFLGIYVVAEISGAMPEFESESPLANQMETVEDNTATAFGLMALALIVVGAVTILGLVAGGGVNGWGARGRR